MMLYAHFLWLAALYAMGCGPDGNEMHGVLLGLAPIALGFAFLLQVTRPFAEIHSILRWLGAPLLLLLPFAIRSVWQVFQTVNVNNAAICTGGVPATWQTLWVPVQFVTLVLISFLLIRMWRNVRSDAAGDVNA
ncbi:MAG: hypothetical protein OES10_15620 [Gammaproteobacteria bacterium]|nr:hypothetical protein [Gammaproteobacteria bacterium]